MGIKKRGGVYHADYYDEKGKRQRVTLGVGSKRVAEQLYAELLLDVSRAKLGMPRRARRRGQGAARKHLETYLQHLEAHGGRDGGPANLTHAKDVRAALTRFLDDRAIVSLLQVTHEEATAWLQAEAKREPRRKSKRTTVSSRVLQKQANALKAWSRWLFDARLLETHVLLGLKPVLAQVEQLDKRHQRRPLVDAELTKVLASAKEASPYRELCWLTMARTGLRCDEVTKLRWRDVVGLDTTSPRLVLRNSATKNKRGAPRQPVPLAVAAGLERWHSGKLPLGTYKRQEKIREAGRELDDPVFPIVPTVHTWKRDLKKAKVPYETSEGIADRHSLRMKFGTDLINAGHPPQVVMRLMRHSSVKLTLELYAFATDEQRRAAVEALGGAA